MFRFRPPGTKPRHVWGVEFSCSISFFPFLIPNRATPEPRTSPPALSLQFRASTTTSPSSLSYFCPVRKRDFPSSPSFPPSLPFSPSSLEGPISGGTMVVSPPPLEPLPLTTVSHTYKCDFLQLNRRKGRRREKGPNYISPPGALKSRRGWGCYLPTLLFATASSLPFGSVGRKTSRVRTLPFPWSPSSCEG